MKNTSLVVLAVAASCFAATTFAATGSATATGNASSASKSGTISAAAPAGTTPSMDATLNSLSGSYLEVKSAPRVVKIASGSVTLEWDSVKDAAGYIVKYGTTSVANSEDPNAQYTDETDQVNGTGTTVTGLNPKMVYYFALVAVDKQKNESDQYSDELVVNLSAPGVATTGTGGSGSVVTESGLSVLATEVVDDRTIRVEFSAELSQDPVSLKIMKTSDNTNLLIDSVAKDAAAPNTVVVTLASDLAPLSGYSLTALSATSANGDTIAEGVKGFKEFTTAASIPAHQTALNAAGTDPAASGATASGTVVTAPTGMPETGTRETLLVVVALAIAAAIALVARRRSFARQR